MKIRGGLAGDSPPPPSLTPPLGGHLLSSCSARSAPAVDINMETVAMLPEPPYCSLPLGRRAASQIARDLHSDIINRVEINIETPAAFCEDRPQARNVGLTDATANRSRDAVHSRPHAATITNAPAADPMVAAATQTAYSAPFAMPFARRDPSRSEARGVVWRIRQLSGGDWQTRRSPISATIDLRRR